MNNTTKKKRIFLSLPLSQNFQKTFQNWKKHFPSTADITFTKAENLHITLIPLWYEDDIEKVIKLISEFPYKPQPFNLKPLSYELKTFKKGKNMLWLLMEPHQQLLDFKKNLQQYLKKNLNIKVENRPYTPHITLAKSPNTIKELPEINIFPPQENFQKFQLLESHQGSDGSNYELLDEFNV